VNGGSIVRALDALTAISGELGIAGGRRLLLFQAAEDVRSHFIEGIRAPPRTLLEPLFGPEVDGLQDPPIRRHLDHAGNPVAMLPESGTVERALRSRRFRLRGRRLEPTDSTRAADAGAPTPTCSRRDLVGALRHTGSARPGRWFTPARREVDCADLQAALGAGRFERRARRQRTRLEGTHLRKDAGFTLSQIERDGPQRSALSGKVLFADGSSRPRRAG